MCLCVYPYVNEKPFVHVWETGGRVTTTLAHIRWPNKIDPTHLQRIAQFQQQQQKQWELPSPMCDVCGLWRWRQSLRRLRSSVLRCPRVPNISTIYGIYDSVDRRRSQQPVSDIEKERDRDRARSLICQCISTFSRPPRAYSLCANAHTCLFNVQCSAKRFVFISDPQTVKPQNSLDSLSQLEFVRMFFVCVKRIRFHSQVRAVFFALRFCECVFCAAQDDVDDDNDIDEYWVSALRRFWPAGPFAALMLFGKTAVCGVSYVKWCFLLEIYTANCEKSIRPA